jgi:transcription factor Sp
MPQVVQFPMQQTIPVQVPISTANGQTLYQTIHFPVQAFATAIPNIIQASGGQVQMIPQLSQVCGVSVGNTSLLRLHFVVVRTGADFIAPT